MSQQHPQLLHPRKLHLGSRRPIPEPARHGDWAVLGLLCGLKLLLLFLLLLVLLRLEVLFFFLLAKNFAECALAALAVVAVGNREERATNLLDTT